MSEIRWEPWNGLEISEGRRGDWANEIASGGAISFASGDSMVFGEIDTLDGERVIELTDVAIRRTARVPLPDGCPIDKADRLRCAAAALADALSGMLDEDCLVGADCDSPPHAEARAALRLAGRLP